MKKQIVTYANLLCFLLLLVANAASSQQYSNIDKLVKTYPKSFSNPKDLAERINRDFTSETEKARAIFTWIALNTSYDLREARSGAGTIAYTFTDEQDRQRKEQQFRQKSAEKILRSGKGVCQDYSALFHTLCDGTGLKCMDITGTSKAHPVHIGKLPQASDHEWNAVKADGRWQLVDVTWAAGSVSTETGKFVPGFNDAYFFTAPEVFFLNHFPDDKRLLMTDKTEAEFAELPLYYGSYVKADYEIATPQKGILSASKSGTIPFKIIDFPNDSKISYVFTNDGTVHNPNVRLNGNISEFEIAMTTRTRGFLTVFANNEAIATYKIER